MPDVGPRPLAHLLDSRPPVPSSLVRPEHVGGPAAWQELVRAGALVPVWGDVAVPPGTVITSETRVGAIAPLVPPQTAVGGLSAAWVHSGRRRTNRVEVVYPLGVRRPPPTTGRSPRQSAVLRSELQLIGDVLVTTVQRTALDLACSLPTDDALDAVRTLQTECGLDVAAARLALERRHRWLGRPAGRLVLGMLSGMSSGHLPGTAG